TSRRPLSYLNLDLLVGVKPCQNPRIVRLPDIGKLVGHQIPHSDVGTPYSGQVDLIPESVRVVECGLRRVVGLVGIPAKDLVGSGIVNADDEADEPRGRPLDHPASAYPCSVHAYSPPRAQV